MGRCYEQFSLDERCEIARLQAEGASIRKIAAALDRQPSSVSRELKRNAGAGPRAGPYKPSYAQAQTAVRRWSGGKLDRDEGLRDQVLGGLAKGWSPEQVAGRLRLEQGRTLIGVETIYRPGQDQDPQGQTHRRHPQASARPLAAQPQAIPDLRQWNRVRPALPHRPRHLLLRPSCPLAEGRRRERHRTHPATAAPKD